MTKMNNGIFILDFKLLEEQNLSLDEFIVLVKIVQNTRNSDEFLVSLQDKQFIKVIDGNVILRKKGELFIQLILAEQSTPKKVKEPSLDPNLDAFIDEFRELWRGLKQGSMGSPSGCRTKMIRWMEENPKYSREDILKAAKIYIESVSNLYYLQQADFFIFKKEGKDELSRLSAFIEEINDRPITDWTTNLS